MELKKLMEQRATKQAEMKALLDKAGAEERALNKDERVSFDKIEAEIRDLDATINAMQAQRELELSAPVVEEEREVEDEAEERTAEQIAADEERAFADYIRGQYDETRTVYNMTTTDNGAVIPSSIANKIIEEVVDLSPVFQLADRYNVKGTLTIPYYDESSQALVMDYADEFTDGESSIGKLKNITLTGFLGRAITDISKSLINNSQFDIVSFVIHRMAISIAKWLDKELLYGTSSKIDGLSGIKAAQTKTVAGSTAVTTDELIEFQEIVPDAYQANAIWIMNKATRTAIRKLKDSDNNYLLNRDFSSRWGYTLLGKDVYTSENMEQMAAGKTAIYYGDMKGLAVKVSEDINIEVLHEVKARQHAVEVLGFIELDAKVQNSEMLAKLVMHA